MAYSQPHGQESFATTRWSVVLAAADGRDTPRTRGALETLCEHYWYPLYAYVRRKNHGADEAQELTQEFFARCLEKKFLKTVQPERGRFRAHLLAAMKNFLSDRKDHARALKRGGGRAPLSFDRSDAEGRYKLEPVEGMTPEKLFERRWALQLLERVLARLREEHKESGKTNLFERLKDYLSRGEGEGLYKEAATELGMSEGGIKTAVHRMRRRYRELLRDEIAQTLADERDVEDELRCLFKALG